jgi:RHS repeat-associated protein
VAFAYDNAGRRTSLTLPNGVVVEYSYDKASRLTELKYKNGAVDLGNLTYFYDKAGNRTKIGGSFARTGLPDAITSATYDNANRQTVFGGKTMAFDANGNLSSIADASGTTLHTWNARNQLTVMSGPGVSASFVYDGLGRREKKTINASLTEFLYDGVNPVQETSGATVLANILTGPGLDEFLTRTDTVAGMTSYFLPGTLGSALALADDASNLQTEYTYEPFGKSTVTGSSNTNPFQYTGRENDLTGLYYYRNRYYNPTSQRFISEDPLGFVSKDYNLYSYVENNPLLYVDPWGLERSCCNQDLLDCLDKCIRSHDPFDPLFKGALTGAGGTFWKTWIGVNPNLLGGYSPFTTVPRATLGQAGRLAGRTFSPLWIGYGYYLAWWETYCFSACLTDRCLYQ